MDKIAKVILRLSKKERIVVKLILSKIVENDFRGLNVKKLVGHNNIFRIRKGKIRIICIIEKSKPTHILAIERRDDKTYKRF